MTALTDVVRDMLDGRENDEQITVEVSLLWSLVYEAEQPKRRIARLPPGIPTCPICLYRNPGAEPGDTRPVGPHDCEEEG